jgi:hypothetical protein
VHLFGFHSKEYQDAGQQNKQKINLYLQFKSHAAFLEVSAD